MKRSRRRGLGRKVAAGILLTLVLLGAVAWWARDLPRHTVERALSERLGADVALGRLELVSGHRVVLHELVVRRLGGVAWLDHARVERVAAEGPLRAMIDGHFETVALDGVTVVLGPPSPGSPRPPGPPASATIGRIELRRGTLRVEGPRARDHRHAAATVVFEGAFTNFGTALAGEATARADELDAGALAHAGGLAWPPGLAARLARPRATVRVEGPTVAATLAAEGFVVTRARGDRHAASRVEVSGPHATLAARPGGTTTPLSAAVALPGVADLSLEATLDAAYRPAHVEATLRASMSAALVGSLVSFFPGLGPALGEDPDLDASVTARVVHDAGDGTWELQSETIVRRARLARLEALDTSLVLRTTLRSPAPAVGVASVPGALARASGPCTLVVDIGLARDARGRIPPAALPQALEATGDVSIAARRFTGTLHARTAGLGALTLRGTFAPEAVDARYTWTGARARSLLAAAQEAGVIASRVEMPELDAALEASGAVRGAVPMPAISFAVRARDARVRGLPADGVIDAPSVSVDGTFGRERVRASVDVPNAVLGGTRIPSTPFAARATIDLDLADRAIALHATSIESKGLFAAAAVARGTSAQGSAHLVIDGMDLPRWRAHLEPVLGDPLAGATLAGTARAALDLSWGDAGWDVRGPMSLTGGSLASADGARAVEGIAPVLEIEVRGASAPPRIEEARARGKIGGVQALWGSVFADYGEVALDADVRARPRAGEGGGWEFDGELAAPGGARATLNAVAGAEPFRARVRLEVPRLAPFYDALVRRPLGGSVTVLAGLETEGALALDLTVRGTRGTRVGGRLALERVGLRATGLDLRGLSLELPFDLTVLRDGGTLRTSGPALAGRFAFERLVAGGFEIPPLSSRVDLAADTLALREPLVVPLGGGEVRLESLTLADLLQPGRHLETGLTIRGVELAGVLRSLGGPPLEGRVDARFPAVSLTPGAFRVEGGGTVDVFGGRVTIGDISGRDPLSRYPKLAFSAVFRDIDLGRVTRTFDIGEMTGTLEGEVAPLELFGTVPVRLRSSIRTVERPGVPRTINVKAIRNVAVIGTGGELTVFDRGIQRFFRRYTYERLGIEMSLENDAFLLKGLEQRGGKELFLKGRLPLPIDIVNAQPGRAVSFRSMVERLRAIDFGGVTTGAPPAPADRTR